MIRLDAIELDDLLKQAGFTDPEHRRVAWGVAMRESRGTPEIVGGPNGNGSYDWGLFQINDIHRGDPDIDWDRILDGLYNAQIADRWTDHGENWSTWGLGHDGWAGYLERTNYTVWLQVQHDFQVQYDAYPAAMDAALLERLKPTVHMANLKPGLRNDDVKTYQLKLRRYLGETLRKKLNPSGATGYYGSETKAMTQAAYEKTAKKTGSVAWLKGDLTTPGPGLVSRIGLRPV